MPEPEQHRGDDEAPIESPPEGSACAEHPERPALAVCPRCGGYACLACWHHPIRRCHACLMRDPSAAAPPIPWEDPRAGVLARFFGTFATAVRPNASAPAFARSEVGPARSFWALSFLPLAVLASIGTYTQTLIFGDSPAPIVVGAAGTEEIAIDVARAIGIGLGAWLLTVLALGIPFVHLTRAFAEKGYEHAPQRAVLYRAFLLPLSQALAGLIPWAVIDGAGGIGMSVGAVVSVIPVVLLFWTLRATARMATGVGPLASYLVAILPFVVMALVYGLIGRGLEVLMPMSPELRQALEALQAARGGA